MDEPDERGTVRETPKPKPSRLEEARRVIDEYANNLLEIIKKPRTQFH
jgi:hypothetical protein